MLAFSLISVSRVQAGGDQPLSAYRDKNRVLLVFAPSEKTAAYQAQMKLWHEEKSGFEDRQLVVLHLLADHKPSSADESAAALAKRFDVDPQSFAVILIGKDGHGAYRSKEPVTADALYSRIDAMPMRREEMRRQKGKE